MLGMESGPANTYIAGHSVLQNWPVRCARSACLARMNLPRIVEAGSYLYFGLALEWLGMGEMRVSYL